MCATAANLVERVLPEVPLRQLVLTVPFSSRKRRGYDGPLLGALVRKFTDAVPAFYRDRVKETVGVAGETTMPIPASGRGCAARSTWARATGFRSTSDRKVALEKAVVALLLSDELTACRPLQSLTSQRETSV
jgi:hypothetical protein